MASALSQAWSAWRGSSSGAFQNAMMQSPMYLSIVPFRDMMMSVMGVRNRLMSCVSPCGFVLNVSEIAVKPRTSQNSMVIARVSPPSFRRCGCSASRFTMSGER